MNLKSLINKNHSKSIISKNPLDLTINTLKQELSSKISNKFKHEIAYGPFKGMKIHPKMTWNHLDRGAMLLGFYEQEVQSILADNPGKLLINLGAGDGFYAVGSIKSGLYEQSIAFEMNPESRLIINKNAKLNDVENILIYEYATNNFWNDLPWLENNLDKTTLICDVEGAEFDIFDETTFLFFSKSLLIIEIHDWVENGKLKAKKLIDSSKATHSHSVITTGSRNPSDFSELSDFTDDERWLLCSEGRPKLMSWYVFKPKL